MSDIKDSIEEQQRLVAAIRDLQDKEKTLRSAILNELFGDSVVGSIKAEVSNLIVTGEYGLTYKLDQTEIENGIEAGLFSDAVLGAIRVKYELNKKAYDLLGEEDTEMMNEMLTVTPSLPSLKVKVVE